MIPPEPLSAALPRAPEHAARWRIAGDPVLVAALIELAAKANADSTRLAYAKAWRRFHAWAGLYGCDPFDGRPETVALHLAGRRDKAHATLRIDVAGIAYALGLLQHPARHRRPCYRPAAARPCPGEGQRRTPAAASLPAAARRDQVGFWP